MCVAGGLLVLYGIALNRAPAWLLGVLSGVLGLAAAFFGLRWADRRLRSRGKHAGWMFLFFGPHVLGALALEHLGPDLSEKGEVLLFLIVVLVAAPFSVWGLVELTSKPHDGPEP
ncbi:hypothetical protein GCM10009116_13930 [Brevundimonas basaltis]